MPNIFGLAGAQPQTATKFAPIYTGRFSVGLWTNRSPLRDAASTRLIEKFYGAAGDALISGSNVEVTTRLTLGRRPGNSVYDSNSYTSVDRFYEFRSFGPTSEQINVMVDQSDALYSLYNGTKTLLWTKHTGAGQSFMQSVGNSLYWGDGVSNKKWLQTLNKWVANAAWNGPTTSFFSTFIIDPNGNIQQLTGTTLTVTQTQVTSNVLTVTAAGASSIVSIGCQVLFPATMASTFLEKQTVTVTGVSGNTFTASFTNADYGPTLESNILATETTYTATPLSGSSAPTWSTTVPASGNNFAGGTTLDGSAQWTNRGNPVENWGIQLGTKAITPTIGSSAVAWQGSTYFSIAGAIIDPNGNLQQVSTAGKSGATAPTWGTSVGSITNDGTVVWRMIQTAASLTWQPHTNYNPSTTLSLSAVAAASAGTTVYSGIITGGAANALSGTTFVIQGWGHQVNNGTFSCTASTSTTLTLQNASGVAETGAGTATTEGQFIVANAYGENCLFQLAPSKQPTITGNVSAYLYNGPHSGPVGNFTLQNPTSTSSALASLTTLNSLSFTGLPIFSDGSALYWNTVNGAGEYTSNTNVFASYHNSYELIILASLNVPVAGQYTFTIKHYNGMLWGMGNNASLVTGPTVNNQGQTVTAAQGYPILGGTNSPPSGWGGPITDTFTVNCPTAGVYPVEFNYSYWYHSGQIFEVQCNGFPLANGAPESGTNAPVWPGWSTQYAPNYPNVTETDGQLTWFNIGPTSDFTWTASTGFTLPDSTIIDPNGNTESPYRTGVTSSTPPSFETGVNQLTIDNPNLIWINIGKSAVPPSGTISTFNGGWKYCVALVNTLDNTVSNCTPLSASTGNFVGVNGITIPAGAGLPTVIDPQADYVAVFRTTDGFSTPFLIPGATTTYTLPLSTYLTQGYTDTVPDTGLNNLISGAIAGENTPPAAGTQNLAFHLNRIWYSIGNVVYWTAGADTPVGNGVSGTPPLNFANFPSLVKRIVPTAVGAIVFTVSDVYVIQGQGTGSNPIQAPIPIMEGVGLLSYNALDVNGSIIGFFTSDSQFCIVDPSGGASYAGFPIGDQLRMNNGYPGQSWNPANVYVTWHVDGEDQGWYVSDGTNGWYMLRPTPAPEQGYTWSPFATIVGGSKAVQSIEVTPGVHKLLVGPTTTGPILKRDSTTHQDNGQSYSANAVIGSAVLAQPGQVAVVSFITTESIRTGTPLTLGLLIDEAIPYYTGPFDILKKWENDPPGLKPSRSFYSQRFYLSESRDEAACRHVQIQVNWAAENAANELLSLTLFGGYLQET